MGCTDGAGLGAAAETPPEGTPRQRRRLCSRRAQPLLMGTKRCGRAGSWCQRRHRRVSLLLPSACPAHRCGRPGKGEGEVRITPLKFANSFENRRPCICGKTAFIGRKRPAASAFLPSSSGKCQPALLEGLLLRQTPAPGTRRCRGAGGRGVQEQICAQHCAKGGREAGGKARAVP